MDLQTLCIVIILGAVVAMLVRAIFAAGMDKANALKKSKPLPGAVALDDALDKLNETVRIVQQNLGDKAPGRRDPSGARFYIAYLVGIAREIAKMNQIAYGPALETPIRMEMIRLGISGKDTGETIARLLASDEGEHGLVAGEMDGGEACDPAFKGEYFSRIRTYFQDTPVRGQR